MRSAQIYGALCRAAHATQAGRSNLRRDARWARLQLLRLRGAPLAADPAQPATPKKTKLNYFSHCSARICSAVWSACGSAELSSYALAVRLDWSSPALCDSLQ